MLVSLALIYVFYREHLQHRVPVTAVSFDSAYRSLRVLAKLELDVCALARSPCHRNFAEAPKVPIL